MDAYVCPRTHSPLVRDCDALVASDGTRYPIERGIPRFLAYEPQESPAERDKVARLIELAPRHGWRTAVEQVHGAGSPDLRYVTSERRGAYVDLLPLDRTTAVLEVGCSLGQGTSALARRAGSVHAIDVVPGQAAFAAERLRQEGLTNVQISCGGDDCRLPFKDRAFDVAVLNLVLEWCGQRDPGSFVDAQRRLLAELARTLRPGGTVYIATKNRFGLPYLTGMPDEHSHQLPFGSALPRAVLSLLLRATGRGAPRGVLHSLPALSRMLAAAGFERLQPYWAAPDARYPERYVPADGASVAATRAALARESLGATRRTRLLLPWIPAPLVKYVAPSLVFTAVRGGHAPARSEVRRAA
jgi:SAM-dependent methyltransferase